jgi:hypothetical protein
VKDFVDNELNCSDVLDQQAINFKVPEDDEVRQNVDSDNDGIGCEAKEDININYTGKKAILHEEYGNLGDDAIMNVTNVDIASIKKRYNVKEPYW